MLYFTLPIRLAVMLDVYFKFCFEVSVNQGNLRRKRVKSGIVSDILFFIFFKISCIVRL